MKTILVDAWETFVTSEGVHKPLYDLLEIYPNKKIIVTNANPEERQKLGLINLPYDIFTLNHLPDKSDPEYFKKLMQKFNLKVKDLVYFEHNPEAVKSAETLGIKSYYYDSNLKDLQSLKKFLYSNI
jgi:HAD superfamily hydrolase (TIGR01509 family)